VISKWRMGVMRGPESVDVGLDLNIFKILRQDTTPSAASSPADAAVLATDCGVPDLRTAIPTNL
jgi:hypothetical protein